MTLCGGSSPCVNFQSNQEHQWRLKPVVLWGNFSYPTSTIGKKFYPDFTHHAVPSHWKPSTFHTALTTRLLNFFYTPFTLWSVETYPDIWINGINLVSKSSQLYKIRELPAKIKLLIIWVEIVFCQQQKKTTPNNWLWPDFLFKLFIVQSYSR